MAEMQWARQEQRAPGPAHGSWSSRGEWTGSGHRRRDRKWEQFSTKNRGEQRGGGRAKTGDALEGFNGKKPRLCLLGLEESAVSHLHFSINLSWRVAFCRLIFILHLVSDCGVKAQCSLEGFQTPQIRREWYLEVGEGRMINGLDTMDGLGHRAQIEHLGWGTFWVGSLSTWVHSPGVLSGGP